MWEPRPNSVALLAIGSIIGVAFQVNHHRGKDYTVRVSLVSFGSREFQGSVRASTLGMRAREVGSNLWYVSIPYKASGVEDPVIISAWSPDGRVMGSRVLRLLNRDVAIDLPLNYVPPSLARPLGESCRSR
jgi:hypothetical protein